MKKIAFVVMLLLLTQLPEAVAQCAMCRSTLENNFSNGNPGIAAGINAGILYLLAMPYLAVILLGYFWYKSSKNARKEFTSRTAQ
jgi:hypothetical protein